MIKFFKKIAAGVMISILLMQTALANNLLQRQPGATGDDSLGELGGDVVEGIAQELLDNFANLAGPTCSIYGLGIDFVNFFYDGQWSIAEPLMEMSVLFRNQSWRELIWAMEDQRDVFVEQITSLRKKQCTIGFALSVARVADEAQSKQLESEIRSLDRQIVELQGKIDYFGLQRKNMIFDRPYIPDFIKLESDFAIVQRIPTDKIFYWLFTAPKINWDQFKRDAKQFGLTTFEDIKVVLQNLPDSCFAVVNVFDQLRMYFAFNFRLDSKNGVYQEIHEGREYKSFREFVEQNSSAIIQAYGDSPLCRRAESGTVPEPDVTSAEAQYEQLFASLEFSIEKISARLPELQAAMAQMEQKRRASGSLNSDEEQILLALQRDSGIYQGMIEYYVLLMAKVGSPASQSLAALSESLSSFVEAIVGVQRDQDGKLKSRISLSEKFQKSKERQLQKICGRIEAMYRESGRDTSMLPIIGNANGFTYCRAKPECQDVNLSNFAGGSEGLKKLAECAGILFDSSELGLSQQTIDVLEEAGDDIGSILEQRSYNDLLKLRDLHFTSLREQYKAVYGADTAGTAQLETILRDVKTDLCGSPAGPSSTANSGVCGNETFDPDQTAPKNHMSLMRKIYHDFWNFCDEQEGTCTAPENPEE